LHKFFVVTTSILQLRIVNQKYMLEMALIWQLPTNALHKNLKIY